MSKDGNKMMDLEVLPIRFREAIAHHKFLLEKLNAILQVA